MNTERLEMTKPEVLWIENSFSEEYEKSLKTARYGIPLMEFVGVVIFSMFFFRTQYGRLIGLVIAAIIATIAILALRSGDGNLPTKNRS